MEGDSIDKQPGMYTPPPLGKGTEEPFDIWEEFQELARQSHTLDTLKQIAKPGMHHPDMRSVVEKTLGMELPEDSGELLEEILEKTSVALGLDKYLITIDDVLGWFNMVNNFPEDYTTKKKIKTAFMNEVGAMKITDRPSALTEEDIDVAKSHLQPGDIVLVGSLNTWSKFLFGGPMTHAMIYVGNDKFIHAVGRGVEEMSVEDACEWYDTMMIFRVEDSEGFDSDKVVEFAKSKIGTGFDFGFEGDSERLYCTALATRALEYAGAAPGLPGEMQFQNPARKRLADLLGIDAIHPMDFTESSLIEIYRSNNLEDDPENGDLLFIEDQQEEEFPEDFKEEA